MAANKTTETEVNVIDFINAVADETKRNDSLQIIELMKKQTGFETEMWGPSIVGFGSYHYKYESGREGDMPLVCFSPRKSAIVLYLSLNAERRDELLPKFGKYKTDGGCIHIKKLIDINIDILKEMIVNTVENNKSKYQS